MQLSRFVPVLVSVLLISAAFVSGIVVTNLLTRSNAPTAAYYEFGPGMMWRSSGVAPSVPAGYGMMGRRTTLDGWGMMGGVGIWRGTLPTGSAITFEKAVEIARNYVASYGNTDLKLTEVMEFDDNFYGEAKEQSTGIHTFEFLIDKYSGAAYPEFGPNMMWNTRYGHMGGAGFSGMMGGYLGVNPGTKKTLTADQAKAAAQQFISTSVPGTILETEADSFYGYYTIHVLKDGKTYGMLSVNGLTGQVWYHTWHGNFVQLKEFD